MGGDNALTIPLQAISELIHEIEDVDFVAFGKGNEVPSLIDKTPKFKDRFKFVEVQSVILEDEKPSVALRKSRGTSMSAAIELVAKGDAHAVVSAGNTGALMAIAMYQLKLLESIDRPAILAIIPRLDGRACLLDVGANVMCQSRNLLDFAILGTKFAQVIFDKENPTVGLLNIGKEEIKGSDLVKSSHEALQGSNLNYRGYVEANELLTGDIDVIVTDGFSGNIALKAMEGSGKFCLKAIKLAASKSTLAKLGLILFKFFSPKGAISLDPSEYNGGIFLGLNGIVVKSHGSADVRAFKTSLKHAISLARGDLIALIKKEGVQDD